MKQIIFISIFVAFFYTTKINAQTCGSPVAGPIIQQVTHKSDYVDGLFWSPNRLLYVNRFDPHVCRLKSNGANSCTKLEGLTEISSVYSIKNDMYKLIIFADRKVIRLTSNTTQDGEPVDSYTMETITTITYNPLFNIMETVTDTKGRTIIGVNTINLLGLYYSKVYMVDADYVVTELISENVIDRSTGIVFSSDYKNLFIADSEKNVIYRFDYNVRKGTIGKHEVVFNETKYDEYEGYIAALGITKTNHLWISTSQSGVIRLYDWKNQQYLQTIKIPSSLPTSICYGGEKLDVLFIGTKKEKYDQSMYNIGSGAVYAVSGTGTVGFQQNQLFEPKMQDMQFKNAYYMTPSELEKMASVDESLTEA